MLGYYDYVIVGASVAGINALDLVRKGDPGASILVIDQEREFPYDKPPLSKAFLSGRMGEHELRFKAPEYWLTPNVHLMMGHAVRALGPDHSLAVADRHICAGAVVLTPGCRARHLADLPPGMQATLRTLKDARSLRAGLGATAEVIVGAGFIGLEVASSLREQGIDVHVVEVLDLPMKGLLGETVGTWILDLAASKGVELHVGSRIESAEWTQRDTITLNLSSGPTLTCRRILAGIGVTPNTEWLHRSDIALADGIECDEFLHTSVDGVFAAGDAARFPTPCGDGSSRVEHWTTAAELGRTAGANAVAWRRGMPLKPCRPIPYAWSDQFGVKVQTVGWFGGADTVIVHEATTTTLYVEYMTGGRLSGALGVGNSRRVMLARAFLLREVG